MQNIGHIAGSLVAQSTGSQAPSVARPPTLKPETLADCRAIAEWASATMPAVAAAAPGRILKRLEYLDAMLPRRNQDEQAGELRTTAYVTMLSGQPDEALAFMVREACRLYNWFPTIKQLLDILADYRPPVSEQAQALIECDRFAEQAFALWMGNLAAGRPIGEVPEQWMRIAVERGHMRRLDDGTFVSRVLYHGPFRAYIAPAREAMPYLHVSPPAPIEAPQAQAA